MFGDHIYKPSLFKELKEVNTKPVNKEKINNLVLNYLITEGYESAACDFLEEAGIPIQEYQSLELGNPADSVDKFNKLSLVRGFSTLTQRSEYKRLIFEGDVSKVIERLNLEYPFLLDKNNLLYFKIMLLYLVEIIKKYQKEAAADGLIDGRKPRPSDANKKKRRVSSVTSDKKKHRRKSSVSAVALNPEQLKREKQLFDKITCVINEKIFPRIVNNDYFLKELEWVMSLLLLNSDDLKNNNLPKELVELVENDNLKNEVFNMVNNSIIDYDSIFISNKNTFNLMNKKNFNLKGSGPYGKVRKNIQYEKNKYKFYQDSDSEQDRDEDILMNDSTESYKDKDIDTNNINNSVIKKDLLQGDNTNQDYEERLTKEMILKRTLNNNMNSNFKKFINLWIWSENQRKNYGSFDDILHTDFEQLL